jgi:hypothetical protein
MVHGSGVYDGPLTPLGARPRLVLGAQDTPAEARVAIVPTAARATSEARTMMPDELLVKEGQQSGAGGEEGRENHHGSTRGCKPSCQMMLAAQHRTTASPRD